MFLLLRALFLVLIIGCLFGCGTDGDSTEIPIITIELIDQEDDNVSFRLSFMPPPANDLAVLIETQALGPFGDDYEIGYTTWLKVPRFSNTRDFKLDLDTSVPWEVRILPLSGRNLNTFSLEGTEVPVGFDFKQYGLGDLSSVTTKRILTQLLVDWPRSSGSPSASLPANAILTFIFDREPEDITVSHRNFITDANRIIVEGLFPIGDIAIELSWNGGRQHFTWYHTITDPDFEPPKIVDLQVFDKDGGWIPIPLAAKDGGANAIPVAIPIPIIILDDPNFLDGWEWRLPVDTGEIRIAFSENIWFHEEVTGIPDIQTENGTKLGWLAEKRVDLIGWSAEMLDWRGRSFRLLLSDGQPLKPETTYAVAGIVTDFANDTEIKLTFTTSEK